MDDHSKTFRPLPIEPSTTDLAFMRDVFVVGFVVGAVLGVAGRKALLLRKPASAKRGRRVVRRRRVAKELP